jgi:geranylgeranyl pyrophosphate synthase
MIETNRILRVPPLKSVRDNLRKQVALYVSQNNILPPSDFETLEHHAKIILGKLGEETESLSFILVLLGNEIWRKTVESTPFHRRLLLLPQCLRDNNKCRGEFDDLGLICAGCKNCHIDEIIMKAEKLGYTTLVAEGTTVAIGLVEEGSIDAVLGVSCMPVLQNSFGPVTKAAVPAMAVPLLQDGCENSSVDYDWLFSEMEQYSGEARFQPLSVSLIKNQVAHYFSEMNLKRYFPAGNETEKLALRSMAMGGHRMRPLLSLLAYQSYAGEILDEIQSGLAVIIECFHKASLVHDDIEDDEDFRYNQPALHKSEGIPAAINTGDYLIGKGYRLLSEMPCEPSVKAECLKIVSASHLKLAEGQGADIMLTRHMARKSVEEVLKIFEQKTGEAVKVALLMGAIAGKAPQDEMEILSRFSEWFGIAYQIRDDLNELREDNELKHAFDFPFLLALLNRDMNGESPSFSEVLDPRNFNVLSGYFEQFTIEEKAEKYLAEYIGKCHFQLDKLQNQKLRLSLYGLMGKVFKS